MYNSKSITLKRNKESSLRRFHPWIFSGAIARADDGINDGDVVRVLTSEGEYIATGHYGRGSIAVRILAFEDCGIDYDFWLRQIRHAVEMRRELLGHCPDTNTFRLIHGEGDNLPALIVDVYGETAVMQAHSTGMHRSRHEIAKAIVEAMQGRIKAVYYKSANTLPFAEEAAAHDGFLIGRATDNVAMENGLKFHIDWEKGQKTGFFVDQRDNRKLLEQYAEGKRVLNMFCYTGGFSVYALRGGAELVHSVDSSAMAIELTKQNVAINQMQGRHEAFAQDAFKFLQQTTPGAYDLIILDPPAFAKHLDAVKSAIRGYTRLNALAFEKISHSGIIFTFSCSQAVSPQQFRLAVFTAATQARRNVRIIHQLHQAPDHPINIFHPEGEYLKGLVLYVE